MAKVVINPDNASNAFFNILDVIKALKNHEGVLNAPISDEGDDDVAYSIGECLEDIKVFLQELDEECNSDAQQD